MVKRIILSLTFLAGVLAGLATLLSPSQIAMAAAGINLEVRARVKDGNGAVLEARVPARGTLHSGDGIQIRVSSQRDAYVYVVIYGSTYSASLLYPSVGKDAFVRAGEERVIPGPDAFLPLDENTGVETIFAISSPTPLDQVSSLLVRMESHGGDLLAVEGVLAERFDVYARSDFEHVAGFAPRSLDLPQETVASEEPAQPAPAAIVPAPAAIVPAPAAIVPAPAAIVPAPAAIVPAPAAIVPAPAAIVPAPAAIVPAPAAIVPAPVVVEELVQAAAPEPAGDATVLGGEGSKIEWLLAGGDPDELPTSDGEQFTSAEFFEREAEVSSASTEPAPDQPAATETKSRGLGGTLKSWFGFGETTPEETTRGAEALAADPVVENDGGGAVAIPLASPAESETTAAALASQSPSVVATESSVRSAAAEPASTASGLGEDVPAPSAAEPEDSPFDDPQLDGLSNALSLELGLEGGAKDPASGDRNAEEGDLLSTLGSWFTSDSGAQQAVGRESLGGASAPLADFEPEVKVVTGETFEAVKGAESVAPEPEVTVLAPAAEAGEASTGPTTETPSITEGEPDANEPEHAVTSRPDALDVQETQSPSGMAKFFAGSVPENASSTPGEERLEQPALTASVDEPAEQAMVAAAPQPPGSPELPVTEAGEAKKQPSGVSRFFAGLFSGTANATESAAPVPAKEEGSASPPVDAGHDSMPAPEPLASGGTEQAGVLEIAAEPSKVRAAEPIAGAEGGVASVEELQVPGEAPGEEVVQPLSVVEASAVPVEDREVPAEGPSAELAEPVSVDAANLAPVEALEVVAAEQDAQTPAPVSAAQENGASTSQGGAERESAEVAVQPESAAQASMALEGDSTAQSKRSLWGAITGFLGRGETKERTGAGPHVILQGSGAAARGQDVVGETAEIATTGDQSITANTLTSGVIDGPPSKGGAVVLKGNREQVLGPDAQVLESQGRKISTLLGEEPEPEPATADKAELPAETVTALPTSSGTSEVTVTAYASEALATLSELPGGRIDLSAVSLASYADTVEIDVTASDGISRGVVLVVTPTGAGSGALLSESGHVLTNWHLVQEYPLVSVLFKQEHGDQPSTERAYAARVVKLNKFSDLALLEIQNPPAGLTPVGLTSETELERGQIVHAIGHPRGGRWKHTVATVAQVKPDASWRSESDVVHRGTVIQAQVQEDPGATGAPLFNRKLELIGISASAGRRAGQLNALDVSEIRAFLGE